MKPVAWSVIGVVAGIWLLTALAMGCHPEKLPEAPAPPPPPPQPFSFELIAQSSTGPWVYLLTEQATSNRWVIVESKASLQFRPIP